MNSIKVLKDKISNSAVSKRETVQYVLWIGFMPFVRGIINCIFTSSIKYPFFRGKQTNILFKHKLFTGKGVYIGSYSHLNCLSKEGVKLGEKVTIREYAWLQVTSKLDNPGIGVTIGNNTYIGPRSYIGAAAKISIGSHCQLGGNVSIIAESHSFAQEKRIYDQEVTRKGITIGDDCWIGNNVVILDGVTLGNGVVVGAGAIVTKSFADNSVIAGVPAKIIKYRNEN